MNKLKLVIVDSQIKAIVKSNLVLSGLQSEMIDKIIKDLSGDILNMLESVCLELDWDLYDHKKSGTKLNQKTTRSISKTSSIWNFGKTQKQDEEIAEKIEHDLLLAQAIHRGLESGYSILEIIEQILPDIEEPDSITH